MSNGILSVSRSWLLYLDDLIASAEKIGRLTAGHTITQFVADEAAFDAVLVNLQVIGEAIKKLPANARALLPEADRSGPASPFPLSGGPGCRPQFRGHRPPAGR